jgi:pyruvate/2-oxoglutarate/acetoin dehydrogenase E1 component
MESTLMDEVTYIEGVKRGIEKSMREHDNVVLFGQDVGAFGGAFKATLGLQEEFGEARVFDTPICESAMIGAAIGMATQGLRPILEFQFADFGMTAFHQLLNNASTMHYRTGTAVPITVRAPCGGGFGGGPFHSEDLEAFFAHIPGLKVVYPAFPSDAAGLLYSAVMDNNPVIYLENKYLYRHVKERIPDEIKEVAIGSARICRSGSDAVVITYGAMVHESMVAAERIEREHGHEIMVVDLRTLKPYDTDTILAAVAVTNRALVVHEAWQTGGFGAEIAAFIAQNAFHLLDAPVRRVGAPDAPIPFAQVLEDAYRPNTDGIEAALMDLIEY